MTKAEIHITTNPKIVVTITVSTELNISNILYPLAPAGGIEPPLLRLTAVRFAN